MDPAVVAQIGSFELGQAGTYGARLLGLLSDALSLLSAQWRDGLFSVAVIAASCLLCGLLANGAHTGRAAEFVGALAICGACVGSLSSMIRLATQTLEQLSDYGLVLLPSMMALGAMSSTATGTGAAATGGIVFLDLFLQIGTRILIPLVWLICAAAVADLILGEGRLQALLRLLKWLAGTLLKWTMYLFTGYLGLSGLFGGGVDAARVKTARVALSSVVPLVGGILSDASESVLAAASALKSSVGLYGMLAIAAICLFPFLRLGAQYLLMKLGAAIGGLLGQPRLAALTEQLAGAFGLLLGLCGAYSVGMLLCVALCVRMVGG